MMNVSGEDEHSRPSTLIPHLAVKVVVNAPPVDGILQQAVQHLPLWARRGVLGGKGEGSSGADVVNSRGSANQLAKWGTLSLPHLGGQLNDVGTAAQVSPAELVEFGPTLGRGGDRGEVCITRVPARL